jgi:hypothetical protein
MLPLSRRACTTSPSAWMCRTRRFSEGLRWGISGTEGVLPRPLAVASGATLRPMHACTKAVAPAVPSARAPQAAVCGSMHASHACCRDWQRAGEIVLPRLVAGHACARCRGWQRAARCAQSRAHCHEPRTPRRLMRAWHACVQDGPFGRVVEACNA